MTESSVSTIDLDALTPKEIDTKLAELWPAIQRSTAWLHGEYQTLVDLSKGGRRFGGSYYTREAVEARIEEHKAEIARLQAEAEPYEIEYAKRPWRRYFLVTNTNGHVHRGMDCSTCFPTTQYGWLPNLSGCDEAAMIEEWGELACTVCFPTAPANPHYYRPSRRDAEAQAVRAAEKAARDAEKAAKAITDVDGSPLRGEHGVLKTKVAARNELSSLVQFATFYGPARYADQIAKLVPALEAAGMDPQSVIAKAVKKATKEGGTYGSALMAALAQ